MNQPLIFVSYSHKDEAEKSRLLTHLGVLQHAGKVNLWSDDQISAGRTWEQEIDQAMNQARVAILLVSADFLNSDFITRNEVPRLLDRRSNEGLMVFPVIAKDCAWRRVGWLSQMNVRPKNGEPVWGDDGRYADKYLAAIAEEVASLLENGDKACVPPPPPAVNSGLEPVKGDLASKGLFALSELMAEDNVREAVVAFGIHFQDACQQIDVLANYKDMHDLLHTLQFHCYDRIIDEAKNFPEAESRDNLWDHELTLQNIINDLREVASRGSLAENETTWIQENLAPAHECLHLAIETSEIKQLNRVAWLLNRVLANQPARINTRLNDAARALRLPKLVGAMMVVRDRLRGLNLDAERVHEFEIGVDGLAKLNQSLTALISSHDEWQMSDLELRRIEANFAQHLDELEYSWPSLKASLARLCGESAETWAVALKADGERLESAIATQDSAKIKQYFRRYRRQAGDRFYKVDVNLKRQCDELRKVGEPLASVLRVIE